MNINLTKIELNYMDKIKRKIKQSKRISLLSTIKKKVNK